MLLEVKPDAVFIATPWELYGIQAVGAMQAGAHAFVEIPISLTIA
jgi:predicted dehydrogenase